MIIQILLYMRTRHMKNVDKKIEELKGHTEQQLFDINKRLEEICGKLFEKFKNQIKEEFTNELIKR